MNRIRTKVNWIKWLVVLLVMVILIPAPAVEAQTPTVLTIEVKDMITAGTAAHIRRAVTEAEERQVEALVLLINTPGGLVDATLDIISAMTGSEVPVITFVTPQGSIAASAGAFILLGGHVAAMSPGTTTGAAMPVMMTPGEEGTQTADDKSILFLAGHIRSIAESNNRPADVAERFVTENLTLSSGDALEKGIIEYISSSVPLLLEEIHGSTIQIQEKAVVFNTAGAQIETLEKSLTERITHLISNPQVTLILLLVGVYGLIIGFSNPGTFVPEVLGAISLVLALFGLGMFEVNMFAVVLFILGVGLLIAEALTPTYGILGAGGVISLVLGIIFLPVEPLVADRWLFQFRLMAAGIGIVGSVFLLVLLAGLIRLRKLPVRMGNTEFANDEGRVLDSLDPDGMIIIRGELWKARSMSGETIEPGVSVKVVKREELTCLVEPVEKKHTTGS